MPARLAVVVNARAGAHLSDGPRIGQRRLAAVFADIGLKPELHWVDSTELADTLRRIKAREIDTIVVGGGDGTLNMAAALLADTPVKLGILPLGTFNHFARDLRIPLELKAAVRVLRQGVLRVVDVGEVNGRVFLNNASVGMYPYAVRRRNFYQQHLGLPKLPAMGYALLGVFWRLPMLKVWLQTEGKQEFIKTPFIFLGNNLYGVNPITGIYRQTLNEGRLSIFYTRRESRLTLIKIAIKTLLGRIRETPELEMLVTEAVTIKTHNKQLRLAMDGEITMLEPPLQFRIRPQALRVIVPPG